MPGAKNVGLGSYVWLVTARRLALSQSHLYYYDRYESKTPCCEVDAGISADCGAGRRPAGDKPE
jgi:hypothetical protein